MLEEISAAAGKPGYQTSEFWRGVILKVLAILAVIFHSDLNGTATWVPTAATALAGLDTALYSLGRSKVKAAKVQAAAQASFAPLHTEAPPATTTTVATDGASASS